MKEVSRLVLAGMLGLLLNLPLHTLAQNTGGVFGPVVSEGHSSLQYRIAYEEKAGVYAHRLHFQQAINGDLMWRVVGQRREMGNGDEQHDFVQGELFWQMPDIKSNWQHGFRFDVQVRDDDRSNGLGFHWMNDVYLNDEWMARFLVMSSVQVGHNRDSGVFLQTRGSLNYRYSPGVNVALSMFNVYGALDDLPGFDDQRHQFGPTVSVGMGQGWQFQGGYLAGLTDSTPDHTFHLWLTKAF